MTNGTVDTRLRELRTLYDRELSENIMPFWVRHVRDAEAGGYHTCLDRDGTVYDYDKVCMWHAGRVIWTLSFLYNEYKKQSDWRDLAGWGVDFVQKHGFTPEGTMYYGLSREGRPIEASRDVYTELSAVLGFTEYARATGDGPLHEQAHDLFMKTWRAMHDPEAGHRPFMHQTRPVRIHGHSMITLNVLQELRRFHNDGRYDHLIDECIDTMANVHLDRERKALFELRTWDGEAVPGFQGRWINPGHMIEGGTFVIHEGKRRNDNSLISLGVDLIDWGFTWGWDAEYGGIFNDVDCDGLPVPSGDALRYEAKLWWQHAEALYGTLLAYLVTGEYRFLQWHEMVHDYSFSHFADPVYGEWIALLDRRGNPIGRAKGTARKNPFHIARNFYLCYRAAETALSE